MVHVPGVHGWVRRRQAVLPPGSLKKTATAYPEKKIRKIILWLGDWELREDRGLHLGVSNHRRRSHWAARFVYCITLVMIKNGC